VDLLLLLLLLLLLRSRLSWAALLAVRVYNVSTSLHDRNLCCQDAKACRKSMVTGALCKRYCIVSTSFAFTAG
jgi:hypothetical protein